MHDERPIAAGPPSRFTPIIRRARHDDAAGIGKVHALSQHATYRGIVSDAWLDRVNPRERARWWTRALRSHGDDWVDLVAEVEGQVVGFSCAGPTGLGPGTAAAAYDLYCLYVRPGWERRGLGHALVEQTFDLLREREIADLQVLCLRDTGSHLFYEALGGRLIEQGHHRDVDGDEGVLLAHRVYRYALSPHGDPAGS